MTKVYPFRLPAEVVEILTLYKQEHRCKTLKEAFVSLVLTLGKQPEITIDTKTADNPCSRRIIISKEHYCVNKPPKAVKLLSLDICKVCKVRQFGLPAKALSGISENSLITDETRKKYPHYEPKTRPWKGDPDEYIDRTEERGY